MTRDTDGARMRAILVAAAAIAFATAPFWSPGFGGFDADAYPIPQDDPPIQPAGYAFAIWSVIYLWLVAHGLYGLVARADDPRWDATRAPLLVALVLGIPWIAVAAMSPLWATVLIWGMALGALTALGRTDHADRWLLTAPIALFSGWLTAATLVATGLLGAGYGILMDETGWAWAMLFAAIALGTAFQRALPHAPLYGTGIAWALTAIAVRNLSQAPAIAGLAGIGAAWMLFAAWRPALARG